MRNDININNANKIMQILLSQYHNKYYCEFNQESLLKLIIKLTIYSKIRFKSEAENKKFQKQKLFSHSMTYFFVMIVLNIFRLQLNT